MKDSIVSSKDLENRLPIDSEFPLVELKSLLLALLESIEKNGNAWSVKEIAHCLNCSERTVRRRIQNDPRFPSPLARTRYVDSGRVRETRCRWNSEDVKDYARLLQKSPLDHA